MNDRFLWKEGEIEMTKDDVEITEEQKKRADAAIDEVIAKFKEMRGRQST